MLHLIILIEMHVALNAVDRAPSDKEVQEQNLYQLAFSLGNA